MPDTHSLYTEVFVSDRTASHSAVEPMDAPSHSSSGIVWPVASESECQRATGGGPDITPCLE